MKVSWIRSRLTYANVAMTLALVFAMTGGAYAAHKYIITSTKQISPTVLKALAGKTGPMGPAGKVGTNGTPGLPGKDGTNGTPGLQGEKGTQGLQGEKGPQGPTGAQGTTGAKGLTGPEGVCSTANCVLPKGVTLKGDYSVVASLPNGFSEKEELSEETAIGSVSFVIPLAAKPAVNYIAIGGTLPPGCTGSVADPGAVSGNLCVFSGVETDNLPGFPLICPVSECGGFIEGSDRTGFGLVAISALKGLVNDGGAWAVTG